MIKKKNIKKYTLPPITMNPNIIPNNNHNRLEKIYRDISIITRVLYQNSVDHEYLLNPDNKTELQYLSTFAKWIDIPYLLENPDITHTIDPIIVELYYWKEPNPTLRIMKQIEQLLQDSKIDTNKIP